MKNLLIYKKYHKTKGKEESKPLYTNAFVKKVVKFK